MSMLDRPISEFDGPCDSVRMPVVPPKGECKPFQEVLIELAHASEVSRVHERRRLAQVSRLSATSSSISRPSRVPGVGFLIGWRGKDGDKVTAWRAESEAVGEYAKNNCVFHYALPRVASSTCATAIGPYLEWARATRLPQVQRADPHPALLRGACRSSGSRRRASASGTAAARSSARARREATSIRCRSSMRRSKARRPITTRYPLAAVTQRPMAMYHSWDSQNAWLRQIHAQNYLFMNPRMARAERHRRRRLDVGRIAVGQGALHGALQRSGRAGHGVDMERDRQGVGCVESRRRTPTSRSAVSCSIT